MNHVSCWIHRRLAMCHVTRRHKTCYTGKETNRNATTNHMHMEPARGTNLQAWKNHIVRKTQQDARHIIQIIFQATYTACSLQHLISSNGRITSQHISRLLVFQLGCFNRGLVHETWMHSSSSNSLSPTMALGFPYS